MPFRFSAQVPWPSSPARRRSGLMSQLCTGREALSRTQPWRWPTRSFRETWDSGWTLDKQNQDSSACLSFLCLCLSYSFVTTIKICIYSTDSLNITNLRGSWFFNISLFFISLFVFVGLDLALRPIHRGIFLYFVTLKDENARVRQAIAYWALSSVLIVCKYG